MNKDEIYRIWAPSDAPWSRWVKPVLFSFMDSRFDLRQPTITQFNTDWASSHGQTVIVVDLPGEEGVLWGVRLARLGYRPIPLYNALPFPPSEKMFPATRPECTVDVLPILTALYREAAALQEIHLVADAPPAFLLDADRRISRKDLEPGVFDNRSVCFTTDFPSAEFLSSRQITQAIVLQRGSNVAGDLLLVLLEWQKAGIQLLRKDPMEAASPKPVVVEPPSLLRRLWYRISVALTLRRAELGGFGGIVESASG
ncbi:MAG TPA: hypothetical protein VGK21_11685 [Candidatus Angelobacter sp.]|jgi:hypothetical protein